MSVSYIPFVGLLVVGVLLHGFCHAEKAPSFSFLQEATSAPATAYYDYIIVGGGTAGCPLAATLSQGARVLLLERGGSPYNNTNIIHMANFMESLRDVSPSSPAQQFISTDGVYNARARVLGGGSALNAGFYSRAETDFVKEAGWDEAAVEQSYEWVEKKVAFEPPVLQWQSAVRDALLEVGVSPYNGFTYDHKYGTKVGGTIFDREGLRHTAADLLEYADPRTITVYLHASVHKILFTRKTSINGKSRPRAYAVVFRDAMGGMHTAYLNPSPHNEVIVSAGALGSPQLLMLSGIGPTNHLRAHGIDVVLDQPMVGQGMSDNPMNAVFVPSPVPVETSLIQVVGITRSGSYIEAASGPNSNFAGISTSQRYGGIIMEKIMGPVSEGHLELRNLNPDDNPSVTFNYFGDPEDLRRCVEGMGTISAVVDSVAFSRFRYPATTARELISAMAASPVNLRPKFLPRTALSLEQFCRDTVMTIWHYHGGCQVGRVVDGDLKVVGVDALRVVDGSTFRKSPGTNPQATVMMLGRYMGIKILQERSLRKGKKIQF